MMERYGFSKVLKTLQRASALILLILTVGCAGQQAQPATDGAEIFQEYCAGCHTIGGGDSIGPDLAGVTQQRDQQWLVDFITDPEEMLASGDPIAVSLSRKYPDESMPVLGLSPAQVSAVIAYIDAPSRPPVLADNLPAGDYARGQALFVGTQHLENGGPACMGCHHSRDNGILGGGILGPDLTDAHTRFSDASLTAALASIPWTTMKPIYATHPLTPQEQSDLRLFLTTSTSQPGSDMELLILAISLSGFAAAVLFFAFVYRKRLRGVRRPMVKQSRARK